MPRARGAHLWCVDGLEYVDFCLGAGPRGYAARDHLNPDLFVIGKAVGGGVPVGLYGVSAAVAGRLWAQAPRESVRPGVR
jgi:glutamate-1-semialdehyde 2,1-aminomutase